VTNGASREQREQARDFPYALERLIIINRFLLLLMLFLVYARVRHATNLTTDLRGVIARMMISPQ